jgi:hypothetical protein
MREGRGLSIFLLFLFLMRTKLGRGVRKREEEDFVYNICII